MTALYTPLHLLGTAGSAPGACTIVAGSVTATALTFAHARPSPLGTYLTTRVFYQRAGGALVEHGTVSTDTNVTITGLDAGYHYVLACVTEAAGGVRGPVVLLHMVTRSAPLVPDYLEYNAQRSIVYVLTNAAIVAAPIQEQGYRAPADGIEEWLTFEMLDSGQRRSRAGVHLGMVLFQVGCFSVGAKDRADKQSAAPWRLAGAVRAALEKKTIGVLDFDTSGLSRVANLQIQEAQAAYNPDREQLSAGGGLSVPGDTGVHYVVVSFAAMLTRRS